MMRKIARNTWVRDACADKGRARVKLALPVGVWVLVAGLASSAFSQDYTLEGASITAEQVERGQQAYTYNCAGCHGDELRSYDSNAPDLGGASFQYNWTNQPLAHMFDRIRTTMPPGMAGSLSDQEYADVIAFILAANGIETSPAEELPGDFGALETITIKQD